MVRSVVRSISPTQKSKGADSMVFGRRDRRAVRIPRNSWQREPHEGPDTLIESTFPRTISTKPCSLSSCLAKKRTEHEFWPPGMQTPAVKKIKRTVQNQEITRYVTLLYWMWTHVYCPYARDRHNKKDSLYEKLTEKAIDGWVCARGNSVRQPGMDGVRVGHW